MHNKEPHTKPEHMQAYTLIRDACTSPDGRESSCCQVFLGNGDADNPAVLVLVDSPDRDLCILFKCPVDDVVAACLQQNQAHITMCPSIRSDWILE